MITEKYLLQIALQVQNDKALQALTKQLDTTARTAPRAQKAVAAVSNNTRTYGRVAQNASYQLQDFAIQVQGGVDPMRALSQQLPQMLVGLNGTAIAVAGLTAALLPTLINLFGESSEQVVRMTERLGSLEDQINQMGQAGNSLDMSAWIKNFNELDKSARAIAASLLEVRIQLAEINLEASLSDFLGFASNDLSGAPSPEIVLQSMADQLGITIGHMEELRSIVKSVDGNIFGNPEVLQRVVEIMGSSDTKAQGLLETLQRLLKARNDLNRANEVALQAVAGVIPPLAGGGAGGSAGVSPEALARIRENDYLQQQREFEAGPPWAGWGESAEEEFSLVAEATDLFGNNFDTMLNGALMGTRELSDGFKDMAKVIIAQLLKLAAYQFIANSFSGTALGDVAASLLPNAKGNVFSGGEVKAFAKGGIVTGPTVFPMAKGMGLMGEAGAEAIAPLRRDSRGNLGVSSPPINVTVNNNVPGVEVVTRQTDSGLTLDVVRQAIAGDFAQGGNAVSRAAEHAYALNRGRGLR